MLEALDGGTRPASPHPSIKESTKGGQPPKAAAPLCGGGAKRRLLYMGLSLGTGSCLWDARPAMCRFAYGFLPGSEHRALQPCVAFPIIANRFQLLQTVSNNVPPLLFHPFPVSSKKGRFHFFVFWASGEGGSCGHVGGTPIRKRTDGPVLGAQTHGETHRQNDTSLAGRPKDTNPYPWRDPYRGIHKGGRPPKAAPPFLWRRREAPLPLYGSLHGYGFMSLKRLASDASFCIWVSPWV